MNDKKFDKIIKRLKEDSRNKSYTERGIPPIFQVSPKAQILIIGQAPGKKVEESLIPFNDKSGEKLVQWMGIDRDTFYSEKIAILPMDFYYPGKGKTGDLPPRSFIAKEYHKDILSLTYDEAVDISLEELKTIVPVRDPLWEEEERLREEYIKIHGERVYDDEDDE